MNKEISKEEWEIIKYFRELYKLRKKYCKRIKLSAEQKKELWEGIMGD